MSDADQLQKATASPGNGGMGTLGALGGVIGAAAKRRVRARASIGESRTDCTTNWVRLSRDMRVRFCRFEEGWGWHGWEYRSNAVWLPLRAPAAVHLRRRFRTRVEARDFCASLAEIMFGDYAGGPPKLSAQPLTEVLRAR